jgi:hypothetical protein
MTRAVCLFCGEGKAGAFVLCPHCGRCPEADDELILSLMMTERYLTGPEREAVGQDIKQGKRPSLDNETRQRFQAHLEEFRQVSVVKQSGC